MDKDGYEEIYFLNTDTYSGTKKYSDRLLDIKDNNYFDLFELEKNKENPGVGGQKRKSGPTTHY